MSDTDRTSCIRCGTCCRKGGPTLHHEDKRILLEGHVGHQHLVTIRKGELVFDPALGALRPSERELVKVRGKGMEWTCCLFDEEHSACSIYGNRFLECRLLKCWEPSALLSVVGRDTVTRADLMNRGDLIVQLIAYHEQECPNGEVGELIDRLSEGNDPEARQRLTELVQKDRAIRLYARRELGMHPDYESFIFGRPLSEILEAHGFQVILQERRPHGPASRQRPQS